MLRMFLPIIVTWGGLFVVNGLAAQRALAVEEVAFIDLDSSRSQPNLHCVMATEAECVIQNEAEYQTLRRYIMGHHLCQDFTLPALDLARHTLLGKYTGGTGCTTEFLRTITRDDGSQTVTYVIDVVQIGGCEPLAMSMNWALVPKIPAEYRVEFTVREVLDLSGEQ